ncbi:MAG TPA: hypothetical protein PLB70_01960 [Paludibacteraceae bacterium]|nr:hypothetical protein [Paludibacteraceae bacterium]
MVKLTAYFVVVAGAAVNVLPEADIVASAGSDVQAKLPSSVAVWVPNSISVPWQTRTVFLVPRFSPSRVKYPSITGLRSSIEKRADFVQVPAVTSYSNSISSRMSVKLSVADVSDRGANVPPSFLALH